MCNYIKYTLLLLWISLKCIGPAKAIEDNPDDLDVDKFINDYIDEVRRTLRLDSEHTINKRSQLEIDFYQLQGLELLVGLKEELCLPVRFPNDLELFVQCSSNLKDERIFAVTLDSKEDEPQSSQTNYLVLNSYLTATNKWSELDRVKVVNGVRLATTRFRGRVYITVAEYHSDTSRGSPVYVVDNDSLKFVHMLNTHYASHVLMWNWQDMETFAAVAISENIPGSKTRYSTQSPVYRWRGSSFSMIDTLPTHNPRALIQFNIRSSMFIAVANFQDDLGDTRVASEIFRYDLASDNFILYQKLPTEAAVDLKYFCFKGSQLSESFLIYASAYHKDDDGSKDYNAASIVYKLSNEEYFVPFQALRVFKISSWLPILSVKDEQESLTLLAASEEGLTSYQYDGWRFVRTGLLYDQKVFGPGFRSMNVFYRNDQTFISAVNKHNEGFKFNVFSPVFKYNTQIEDVKEKIATWVQRMSNELAEGEAKMAKLLEIAKSAPSTSDSFINLGPDVIFQNVEVNEVETFLTKIREEDADEAVGRLLISLNNQLDAVQQMIGILKTKIDQTSIHALKVYKSVSMPTADISCTYSCHIEDLKVNQVNGEDFSEFLANTVDIRKPIDFDGDITFKHLAVREPLDVKKINGHRANTLIDWSTNVTLDNELKVEGDAFLQNDTSVTGRVDGVLLNAEAKNEENISESNVAETTFKTLETLNASKLILIDGKLSEVDFELFNKVTLRTQGDQFFSELQEFNRIEVDELITNSNLNRFIIPSHGLEESWPCTGESCSEEVVEAPAHQDILGARATVPGSNIESMNLVEDEIIIPNDLIIYGSVTIQKGSLDAFDLVDSKHEVSANKLMEFGMPLSHTVIEKPVEFGVTFKAQRLTVDTLNNVDLESLVDPESSDPVIVTGRKEFNGGLIVNGTAELSETVNGVSLTQISNFANTSVLHLDTLTVHRVNTSNVEINANDWHQLETWRDGGWVFLKNLVIEEDVIVKDVLVRGHVNRFHLENLLQDTVFKNGGAYMVTGKKHFVCSLEISNLTLSTLNGINVNTLTPEFVLKKNLMGKNIEVDRLHYEGYLDGIESQMFGEWLLTEGDQSVLGAQNIQSMNADHVSVPPNGIFNSVNMHKLITNGVFLTENTTLNHVVFEGVVSSSQVHIEGKVNDLQVPEDLILSDTESSQHISAHKVFHGNVMVNGTLHSHEKLFSVNFTGLCQAISSHDTHLIIKGYARFKEEPEFLSVNGKNWSNIIDHVWFKEDDLKIYVPLIFQAVQFDYLTVDKINSKSFDDSLSKLVSLSKDETVNGTFYFSNVTVENGLEAKKTSVGGKVQGIQLPSFIKTVLMDGEDQTIYGKMDFSTLIVDGGLTTTGSVNGFDLLRDVMLKNVTHSVITSSLSVMDMWVGDLTVPAGTLVGGVDVEKWNRTAIKTSGNNVIMGDVVIKGQFDPAKGIRVEGLVNGIKFDKEHLMLGDSPQRITGSKLFSTDANLTISKLTVGGYLNQINLTEFYSQQVTTAGDTSISGQKGFIFPMYTGTAVLPEIYQGYNLTWLELQLATPLPRELYHSKMTDIEKKWLLADRSLAGQPYYLKSMTKQQDLDGVLSAVPLKTNKTSVVAEIKLHGNITHLSLLHWSNKHSIFHNMPGTVRYVLTVAPSEVQSVVMPGGELAAYITSSLSLQADSQFVDQREIVRLNDNQPEKIRVQPKVLSGQPGSTILSFFDHKGRTCFIVVADMCRIYCLTKTGRRITLPQFSCQNITKATLIITKGAVYMVGLQTGSDNGLVIIWRLSGKRFIKVLSVSQFNPVSIAATTTTGPHIAVATRHRVGSSHPESIDIYRFIQETTELIQVQSIPSISPKQVLFATLPTNESVMYVASDNPATPLEVFLYRGILGYQSFQVEPTLPTPLDIHAFTDHNHRHFVIINARHKVCILKAEFEGDIIFL